MRSCPSAPTPGATITVHHLILNRNHLLVGGIRPHYYCLPVVKREEHRLALWRRRPAATRGSFSAPTARRTRARQGGGLRLRRRLLGAGGARLPAQVFEAEGALDRLEGFASLNGPAFYGLPPNEGGRLERAGAVPAPAGRDRGRAGRGVRPRLPAHWRVTD